MDLHPRSRRVGALAPLIVALAACGPKSVDFEVKIITTACGGAADPFDGVQFVQLTVNGADLDAPLIQTASASDGKLSLPSIPVGMARTLEVRGYVDDPANAASRPLSIGKSLPFDVPDTVDPAAAQVTINVFLRRVNAFTPPNPASTPGSCAQMRSARAGHTATLLDDGRVYIAGGYDFDSNGKPVALGSAEYFDPASGEFTDAPSMPQAKAFHTAVLLGNGEVFILGGEVYPKDGATPVPEPLALFFDPPSHRYGTKAKRRDGSDLLPRSEHVALLEKSGKVLIAGGIGMGGAPVPDVEWYDPATDDLLVATGEALPAPREITGAPVSGGTSLAIIGGVDGSDIVTKNALLYSWTGSSFHKGTTVQLSHARRSAAATELLDGSVAVLGGTGEASTEQIDGNQATDGPDIGARSALCAVTLADGSVLAIGGKSGSPARSDPSATIVQFGSSMAGTPAPPLKTPRWGHTCTLMADGSVLVTGGVDDSSGTATLLQDAVIYTPAPAN